MRGFVLDASVALRWLLDDPVPAYAHRIRQRLIAGDRAVVPAIWHLEISNGLAVAERRSLLKAQDVDRALLDIEQMVAHAVHTEAALVAARQALATARVSASIWRNSKGYFSPRSMSACGRQPPKREWNWSVEEPAG